MSNKEREFFSLVNRAIFSNPFSDERAEIDVKIAGLSPGVSREDPLNKAIAEVKASVERLEEEGKGTINLFSGDDRTLIEYAFLFDFFYQFFDKFDQLILDQIQEGGSERTQMEKGMVM